MDTTTTDGTATGNGSTPDDRAAPIVHERTYRWTDPAAFAGLLAATPGLELLRSIGDGLPRPPIMDTLGIEPVEVEEGRIVFALTPAGWHYNPLGTVHGGVLATLLDTAAACAVHTRLPAGVGYTSLDLNTRFLRPVTVQTGRLRCEGRVLSMGRRTATAESRVEDGRGRLIAHATSTCMLLDATQPAG